MGAVTKEQTVIQKNKATKLRLYYKNRSDKNNWLHNKHTYTKIQYKIQKCSLPTMCTDTNTLVH